MLADAVVLLVSVLVTVVVPRFIGVEEYGYWQLYLLYAAYVQIAQGGWSDGIIVRKAGVDVSRDLGQWFTMQMVLQLILVSVAAAVLVLVSTFQETSEVRFVLCALAISVAISNCRFMCLRLFQATRQMGLYSANIISDRLTFGALVAGLLLAGVAQFELLIVGSLVARGFALCLSLWWARDVLSHRVRFRLYDLREAFANISSGARTLLAVLSGSMSIAVVRIVVERVWGVEVFSNVSLALSIAGLVSLFVSGLSYALLPYLRRTEPAQSVRLYKSIRGLVSCLLFTSLLLYFPAVYGFGWWLPHFGIAVDLLFLLFPIVVFEGRTALLTVTYLRVARRETTLLWVNVLGLVFSAVLAVFLTGLFGSLHVTVSVILVTVMIKALVLEISLVRQWDLKILSPALLEVVWVVAFVAAIAFIEGREAVVVLFLVGAYVVLRRRDVIDGGRILKDVMFR